jgi:predicted transcriptional regulator of viral defense system
VFDELIADQAGIVSRAQAVAAGLTDGKIRANVDAGRWKRIFPGIYQTFSGDLSRTALLWAVQLRAGPGSALSHETAAELHGLIDRPADHVHVTVPANRRVPPTPGVVVHICQRVDAATMPGPALRRTRVEETVLDLAGRERRLTGAIAWATTACGRRLTTPERLAVALRHRKKLRWRRLLEAVVDDASAGAHSVLEVRYVRDVERGHRLPAGRRQARRAGSYRDVEYREFATVVELDGRAFHPEERRHQDRRRDNETAAGGERTLRYGWGDVVNPCATAIQVARALRAGGWTGHLRPCARPGCPVRRRSTRRPQ